MQVFLNRGLGDLKLGGNGVLVHVNIVFVDRVHNKLITFRLHPSSHERCQVQPRFPVKHQLIVYDLERCLLRYRVLRHLVPANIMIYQPPASCQTTSYTFQLATTRGHTQTHIYSSRNEKKKRRGTQGTATN